MNLNKPKYELGQEVFGIEVITPVTRSFQCPTCKEHTIPEVISKGKIVVFKALVVGIEGFCTSDYDKNIKLILYNVIYKYSLAGQNGGFTCDVNEDEVCTTLEQVMKEANEILIKKENELPGSYEIDIYDKELSNNETNASEE